MFVSEIFYSIQGEGKLIGMPSVFVRTSGCNLRCTWCDTPYASWDPQGTELSIDEILKQVNQHPTSYVVVTGGEPMISPDVAGLCEALKKAGKHITLETAGTVFKAIPIDLASISPKLSNSTPTAPEHQRLAAMHESRRLNIPAIQQLIDHSPDRQLKFVLSSPSDLHEIEQILTQLKNITPSDVQLMPEGTTPEALKTKTPWLTDLCKQKGYRYSPRLHIELYGNKRGT